MKTSVIVALSFLAIVLGTLTLMSTLSNPSLDLAVLARDLGISIAAVATGFAAPLLHRKFSAQEEEAKQV